ncbi:MAG: hypothetical protein JRF33_03130 [Deltaproteobacteria bacterium]|nr:hypothetical protein [Deltaproteobacteria bacterium]
MRPEFCMLGFLFLLSLFAPGARAQALDGKLRACLAERLSARPGPEALGERDAFGLMAVDSGHLLWRSQGRTLAQVEAGPGSLFKVIAAYAALETRKVKPDHVLRCEPGRKPEGPKGQKVRCWTAAGHGPVNLSRALALSCNRYFAWLGGQVGTADLLRSARAFGLGQGTGSDLPGERTGSLPRAPSQAMAGRLAVGQAEGLMVTPLQMLVVAASLANGGRRFRPCSKTPAGPPSEVRAVIESGPSLRFIREGLIQASAYGTGSASGLAQLGMAGKTGTAGWAGMNWHTHGWYMGWAPAARPELALVVFIQEGQGAKDAAAAARQIMEQVQLERKACEGEDR